MNYFREHWPTFFLATMVLGYVLTRGSRLYRVIGGVLLVEGTLIATLLLETDFSYGGTLSKPPPMTFRTAGTQWLVWCVLAAALLAVPVAIMSLREARRPERNTALARYTRMFVIGAAYIAVTAAFSMGGAIIGGILGLSSGGEMDQRRGDDNARAGAVAGAFVGILIAARAHKALRRKESAVRRPRR